MSFWDKVKTFFDGSGNPQPSESFGPLFDANGRATDALPRAMQAAAQQQIDLGTSFQHRELASAVLDAHGHEANIRTETLAANVLLKLRADGWFESRGYEGSSNGKFWPRGGSRPDTQSESPAAPPPPPVTAPAQYDNTPTPRLKTDAPDPLSGGDVLGMSQDELRERAMRGASRDMWTWRRNLIPPARDAGVAIADRGMIVKGLLSEDDVAQMHRAGDLWMQHNDRTTFEKLVAGQQVDDVLRAEKEAKRLLKAQKRKEAAERKAARAAAIAHRRATDIIYLGPGVSGRLGDRRVDVEALEGAGLPILSTPADLAEALGLTISELRWLAYHDEAITRSHYVYFKIPKRSGGMRQLAAPHRKLAAAQRWILDTILRPLPVEDVAHGFVPGRSVVTNASPHVGQDIVLNFDLEDFFPTITFGRIRGMFQQLGYSPAVATILALICSECPRREVTYDKTSYWVAIGARGLPQGACTSPAISNRISRRLDRRLRGMANKRGWAYTRYADDLTFSAPSGHRPEIPMVMASVRHIVQEEGFVLNRKKGRVQRCAGRQLVTGVVVNEKLGVQRTEVRRLGAILHQAKRTGLEAQNREGKTDFEAWLRGKIAYVAMVDPSKGARLRADFEALGRPLSARQEN